MVQAHCTSRAGEQDEALCPSGPSETSEDNTPWESRGRNAAKENCRTPCINLWVLCTQLDWSGTHGDAAATLEDTAQQKPAEQSGVQGPCTGTATTSLARTRGTAGPHLELGHTMSKMQPGLWPPSTESSIIFIILLFQHSSAWLQFSEEQIGTFIGHSFLLQPAAA